MRDDRRRRRREVELFSFSMLDCPLARFETAGFFGSHGSGAQGAVSAGKVFGTSGVVDSNASLFCPSEDWP